MNPSQIEHQLQPNLQRLTEKAGRLRALSPLPEAFASSLEHKLRIELTHGSTPIEGNTLTLRETQLLIDEGITPQGAKQLREIHETINHHRALLRLQEPVKSGQRCDEGGICELHGLIMASNDDERSGIYRSDRIMVTGAPVQPIRPEKVPEAMQELSS
jgi:Fic family protein